MSVEGPIHVNLDSLDTMMPLHLVLNMDGHIVHAGRTMRKLLAGESYLGRHMLELFDLKRGTVEQVISMLQEGATGKVLLHIRDPYRTQFIGSAVALDKGEGALVNLSFGISIFDAVRNYRLAGSDFAPTDLTLELLYIAEANAAAMAESRALNERLHGAKERAESDALTDTLTGLRNRRALNHDLNCMIARGLPFTLAHLDLDYFKAVNDTLGHAAGDFVLVEVARILAEETRAEDTVARIGGDEFVLILAGLADRDDLSALAGRIIARLEEPIWFQGRPCRISASVGLALSSRYERPEAARVMSDADMALYASKSAGRASFTFFDPAAGALVTDGFVRRGSG